MTASSGAPKGALDDAAATSLMAQAQLYDAAGKTDPHNGAFRGLGEQLASAVQLQDAKALTPLTTRLTALCGDRERTEATPEAQALLACATVDAVTASASSEADLGSSDGADWAQLRAARYLAEASTTDSTYDDVSDAVSEVYLAAAAADDQRYADAISAAKQACDSL